MARRIRLKYDCLHSFSPVPSRLYLKIGDRIRVNHTKCCYVIEEIYNHWAIGWRRHSKGYTFIIISLFSFVEDLLSCSGKDIPDNTSYHIFFTEKLKYIGPVDIAYNMIRSEMQREIRACSRGFAYDSTNVVYSLEIDSFRRSR